jgi:hypothetical protein
MTPRELASEVWLKLVASMPRVGDDSLDLLEPMADERTIDAANPERDGRITWRITEIGGSKAISHRDEDLERERYGRGRWLRQAGDDDDPPADDAGPDERTDRQRIEDGQRVWRGLLAIAGEEFRPEDDISLLLRLLADKPDVLDEPSGSQWPIGRLVTLLSERPPPRTWTEDEVDNAKRRLMNWIGRLMRKNGLDATDLEGLFAAVARRVEDAKGGPLPRAKRSGTFN